MAYATSLNATIQEIHTLYNEASGTTVVAEYGSIDQAKNASPPRIVWTLTGGRAGTNTRIGAVHTVTANFLVWLWFDDLDQCWTAMHHLMTAIRKSVYGGQTMEFEFTTPTEVEGRHLDRGAVILLQAALNVEMDPLDESEWVDFEGATFFVGMDSPDGVLDDQLIATTEDAVAGSVPLA